MTKIHPQLRDFWFSPMPAERLAILRIATGAFSLWYLLSRFGMLVKMGTSPERSLFDPVGVAAFLSEPLPANGFMALLYLTIGLNVLYILGAKFRAVGPLFALALLFLLCYRNSWSMIYHARNALVLHVLVIGFVSAADAFSWDAWRRKASGMAKAAASEVYGWPVRLLCAATLGTYFLSGVAKVYSELGWGWMGGSALRSQVAVDHIRKAALGAEPSTWLFEALYPYTGFFIVMGAGTMILELGAPLALLHARLGRAWAVLTWLMHWGIFFVMGITFHYQLAGLVFLPFFTVERWPQWLRTQMARLGTGRAAPAGQENPSIVLFDGVCNFCDASVQFVIERDRARRFRFASLQSPYGQERMAEHGLPSTLTSIVLIQEGKVYQKSTAVLRISRGLGGPWAWLYVFAIVPAPIRDTVYSWVARNRYRWFGKRQRCAIPTPETRSLFLE